MDNPITVPLPQDLPTDWTYGQTVAPNGSDVGLPEQYGYNYLMEQVNAAQQAVQEVGEAIPGLVPSSNIDQPNGIAGLDENGTVPLEHGGTASSTSQAALATLGAGTRPNLLINPWFIDQRGDGTYTGPIYGPDCILGTANVTKTRNSDGSLTISTSADISGSTLFLTLLSEEPYDALVGRTFTFSFLTTQRALYSISGTVPTEQPSNGIITTKTFDSITVSILFNTTLGLVGQIGMPNQSLTIISGGIKLEEGNTQTLANHENNQLVLLNTSFDKSSELLKCQRYLLPLGDLCGLGLGSSTTRIWYTVPTPARMRITPVLQGTPLAVYPASESITINLWTVQALNAGNCVLIHADGTGITPNATYGFDGDGAFLSAEL